MLLLFQLSLSFFQAPKQGAREEDEKEKKKAPTRGKKERKKKRCCFCLSQTLLSLQKPKKKGPRARCEMGKQKRKTSLLFPPSLFHPLSLSLSVLSQPILHHFTQPLPISLFSNSLYEIPAGVESIAVVIFLSPLSTEMLPSASTSMITASPSLMSPASILSAIESSSRRMIARLSGRAP